MAALREAAMVGVGVVQLPTMMIWGDLEAGRLVHVLPDWRPRAVIIHAVFPSRRGLLLSIRALLDFLGRECDAAPSRREYSVIMFRLTWGETKMSALAPQKAMVDQFSSSSSRVRHTKKHWKSAIPGWVIREQKRELWLELAVSRTAGIGFRPSRIIPSHASERLVVIKTAAFR